MPSIVKKILIASLSIILCLVIFCLSVWTLILPKFVQSEAFEKKLNTAVKEFADINIKIEKPYLKTSIKPIIELKVDELIISYKNENLAEINDFYGSINFKDIFKKQIKLNVLKAKNFVFKADKLAEITFKKQEKKSKPSNFKVDFYKADIGLDNLDISYNIRNNSSLELFMKDVNISQDENCKNLEFNLEAYLRKNNIEYADIIASTTDEIKLFDNSLEINNLNVDINNSRLKLNSKMDLENLEIKAESDKFLLEDIFKIINSNFIISNGSELLKPLKNPSGKVAFDLNMKNNALSGKIFINNTKAELKDVSNIPLNIEKGIVEISKDKIKFENLLGWYGGNKSNELKIYGDIKDYYKTFDSNIIIDTFATNEFFSKYLAPLINNTIFVVSSPARARITYKAKNGIMDIDVNAGVRKGVEFSVLGQTPLITDYNRGFKGDLHIENNILEIRNINYYIVPELNKDVKPQPVLVLDGKTDLSGNIDNLGFNFEREIPCEFLNIFLGSGFFKKGTIKGSAHVHYINNIPHLNSDIALNKTFIPSQRLYIRNALLKANDNSDILINATGKFKRSEYDLKGNMQNNLNKPYTVKKLALNMDDIDIEKFLASVNNQNQTDNKEIQAKEEAIGSDNYMFDTSILRLNDVDFKLNKGHYKELEFGNIDAKLTLDEKGVLKVQSNKFDIAEGISTLKAECDLKNLKYYLRLGIKGVDSNLIAKVLLNLDKEITGKAYGLIELNSDKTLKLNGNIKFLINDGAIGKIGLVEYVLKVASVFRNPIVMISPATIMDIVSIPEGKFDKITGEMNIDNNIIKKIDIKSYSSSLSALIKGRIDMEKHDMSLRIYTRFSSGKKNMFGFLRNISLNALANKVQLNSRNDANYYSSELSELPQIDVNEDKTQVFLTNVEGDVEHNNFLSSLKKIK